MAETNLVQLIKRIAIDAVNASKQCDYRVGIVISTDPLQIKLSNALILEEEFLHLTQNVSDYVTEFTVNEIETYLTTKTQSTSQWCDRQEITIHNALQKGDQVLMMRKAGGQEYIVIDRVVS